MSGPLESPVFAAHFSPDILEFIRLLSRWNVRYVIVGGEAVIYHGHARLTGDVDFFFEPLPDNVHRLFGALQDFWNGAIPGVSEPNELLPLGTVFQFGRPPNRIDLLNTISDVSFLEAWESRVVETLDIGGDPHPIYFLGKTSLIKNKTAIRRPKDLEDLEFLRP